MFFFLLFFFFYFLVGGGGSGGGAVGLGGVGGGLGACGVHHSAHQPASLGAKCCANYRMTPPSISVPVEIHNL